MPPGDNDDSFTISYFDDVEDQFFVEGIGEGMVGLAVEDAISEGAYKILIARQGDEDAD